MDSVAVGTVHFWTMRRIIRLALIGLITIVTLRPPLAAAQSTSPTLLADRVDISADFRDFANNYYVAGKVVTFDPVTAAGTIQWVRNNRYPRLAFNYVEGVLRPFEGVIFPEKEYDVDPVWPFTIQFVSARTVRIRVKTGPDVQPSERSLMLVGEPPVDKSWQYSKVDGGHRYTSSAGSVTVRENPWRIELRDATGKLLTMTQNPADFENTLSPALPFSYIRRVSDHSRSVAAVWSLSAGEKLFGGGESFTRLDKRGQRVVLSVNDANGAESERMYKPIPFLMSSRGYGLFTHTSAPATFDVGATFHGSNALLLGDDELDLFMFIGTPKEILDAYTTLTGKSPMPPLWTFGFWMSRITYMSEEEVRNVATKLRQYKIPADLIHLDTGWFETDWRSDYQFSKTRFPDPAKLFADLKRDGFHVSLWQLPYFVPKNLLFPEIVSQGLAVRDGKGNLPSEDAVLDFSNPKTIAWYQQKLAALLKLGVGAIKVDFGEAAPFNGVYASGRTGFYEHNLYPLRYNKVVADVTRDVNHENIIWARSAWAGSQRYPLHWGGDSMTSDIGMASTLRGGLSFGLSGFTFWSHDIGGFMGKTNEDLYARWLPFGLLTSHSRSHGFPPREPWEFGEAFTNAFRHAVEMRYSLMPYIYAQAKDSTARGLPMLRALFVEFPDDPGSWGVEDEYLFGSDILVAPLFESGSKSRDVYLPPGTWIDYQTRRSYAGGWHHIDAGPIAVVMLVREGAAIAHIAVAQSTAFMDWSKLEIDVFGGNAQKATGLVALPDGDLKTLTLTRRANAWVLASDPLAGKVTWIVRRPAAAR
jgi:alpha-D-xyloside xylohydrolase